MKRNGERETYFFAPDKDHCHIVVCCIISFYKRSARSNLIFFVAKETRSRFRFTASKRKGKAERGKCSIYKANRPDDDVKERLKQGEHDERCEVKTIKVKERSTFERATDRFRRKK